MFALSDAQKYLWYWRTARDGRRFSPCWIAISYIKFTMRALVVMGKIWGSWLGLKRLDCMLEDDKIGATLVTGWLPLWSCRCYFISNSGGTCRSCPPERLNNPRPRKHLRKRIANADTGRSSPWEHLNPSGSETNTHSVAGVWRETMTVRNINLNAGPIELISGAFVSACSLYTWMYFWKKNARESKGLPLQSINLKRVLRSVWRIAIFLIWRWFCTLK